MAKVGEDCEYWLLPEFLVHDEDGGGEIVSPEIGAGGFSAQFGGGGDNCFTSELTPERMQRWHRHGGGGRFGGQFSGENCFGTELMTREFTHSSSSIGKAAYGFDDHKVWSSPESSLSGPSSGGACGVDRCFSCNSTPRRSVMNSDAALNLLQAAVEEIARLRMVEEAALFQRTMETPAPRRDHPLQHQTYHEQMKAFEFQMLRQQLEVATQKKMQYRQTQRGSVHGGGGRRQTVSPASSSGQRSAFCGIPPPKKRECAGTGVFLPRTVSSSTPVPPPGKKCVNAGSVIVSEARKAPAPAVAAPHKYGGGWSKGLDRAEVVPPRFRSGSGGGMVEERRRITRQRSVAAMDELHLPQDWSY